MIKKIRLLGLMLLASAAVSAQTVTGRVTAATDGSALPGVSVLVKGTTTGTATDGDGKYSVSVSDANGGVLVFSFIGYQTKEVPIQGQTTIDVSLGEDATSLDEVVVTALGISRETKTLVYATQQVKPTQLTEVRDANNVVNSLAGKVANLQIFQGSGGPGSGARFVLRGNRSLQGNNNALIVIDGVPITNSTYGTVTSDFGGLQGSDGASNINPDDIESMTILRGASAAALYGSAAGNGVIVITTKKGSKDKVSVNVNSGVTFEKPFVMPKFQNEYGQGNSGVIQTNLDGTAKNGESWGPKMDGHSFLGYNGEQRNYSAQPDNVKDFFRTGTTLNNSIGISGGSEKMQTYLSYTNNRVQGILPKNDLDRNTITLRLSNNISKKLRTDAKVTYINQQIFHKYETGESALSPLLAIYQIPRNVSLADAQHYQDLNNVKLPVPAPYPVINKALYQNPYWIVNNTKTNEKRNRLMGFLSAQYDITNWLKVSGRANMDKYTDAVERTFDAGTIGISGIGGTYSRDQYDITQIWLDAMLEGSNKIGGDLKIDYRIGTIYQDNKYNSLSTVANGLDVANKFGLNFATTRNYGQGATQVRTEAVFGQINLAYKESIFLDASLRNDWSSPLPSPYTYQYPSVGLSGILSDLITMPEAISFLKLTSNYAVVGNGGQPYLRFPNYFYSAGGTNGFIYRGLTQALPGLKPEKVKNLELGFEAKFLENKLGLQFNYYKSNSNNQLLRIQVPVATGYTDKYINAGNIQNQGVELVINGSPVTKGAFNWDVGFNFGLNRNKIISLDPNLKSAPLSGSGFGRSATPVVEEGGRYGEMKAFTWKKDANGNYLVNSDGTPYSTLSDNALVKLGTFMPKATLGLTNTFKYKSITARVLVDGRIGGTIIDGTEMFLAYNGALASTTQYRDGGWKLNGKDAVTGAPVDKAITAQQFWQTASGGRYGSAGFFAYNATSFRIRELSVGYNIPVPQKFGIKSARLSVVARNLLFLYRGRAIMDIPGLAKRKMNFDPDMSLGNSNWQGVSYGNLPSTRSLGFNLQLTF